jgi:hypothetical protein
MTPNETLSTVNALKGDRQDDYYKNTTTSNGRLVPPARASQSRPPSSKR